ncbi:hypothetical protein PTMSG1_01512 [Pyrenophora teres f. maculata]|nr:hypothetical protein PTMSG1_01512 [Pyrenophora teres f. maculata]
MPVSDPLSWTVDELIAEICHSKALYQAAGVSTANIPDGTALEKQLRARNITGRKFLDAFDTSEIAVKNALNIASLSQRLALVNVSNLLRSPSYTHDQQEATAGLKSLNLSRESRLGLPDSSDLAANGRKRKKVTPVTTAPVPKRPQAAQAHATAPSPGFLPDASADTESWSHLLRWENEAATDDVVDFAAEEYQEDEDSEDEDPPDSEEDVEEAPCPSKLSQKQVVDIINERIDFYTTSWRPNKGVARGEEIDYDTVRMWEEAEASGQRKALVQKYNMDHTYYRQRLDTLCDEIVKFPGRNAEQVWRQCSHLEVTIESMELAGWLRDIYSLSPVVNSDEEELHSQDEPQPIDHSPVQLPQPTAPIEIISLGSPSSQSENEEEMAGNVRTFRRRLSTPDSVIAESVKPAMPTYPEVVPTRTPINHGDEPEHASIGTVRRWLWTDLMEHLDRKRVVSKAILELRADDRELIRNRVRHVGKIASIREIAACVEMRWRGESKLRGVLPRDMPKIMVVTDLFLSWWFCRSYFKGPKASKEELTELKLCIEEGSAEMTTFYDYVHTVMGTTFSEEALQHPERPSQAEIIEISDDDD